MKHWEFTGEEKTVLGATLKRIRATSKFTLAFGIAIEAGENGGWIEKEENLSENAWVSGDAMVLDNARVYDNAWVSDNAWVFGNAQVSGNARVFNDVQVSGNARVGGNARAGGHHMLVLGNAHVCGKAHYLQIGPAGSRNDYTTFMRDKKGVIYVSCGCFFGSIMEFREKVRETHGNNKHAKVYLAAADLAELQIDTTPIEDELELPKEEENA